MTNFDNNLNINNTGRTYKTNAKAKKGEEIKQHVKSEEIASEIKNDGTLAADAYGRALLQQVGKIENPAMVQSVKDAIDFYVKNPALAAATVKTGDDIFEMLEAEGAENAYEKSCCGSCDAAYSKLN